MSSVAVQQQSDSPIFFKSRSGRAKNAASKRVVISHEEENASSDSSEGECDEEIDKEQEASSVRRAPKRRRVGIVTRQEGQSLDGNFTQPTLSTTTTEIRPVPQSQHLAEVALLGTRRPEPQRKSDRSRIRADEHDTRPAGVYQLPIQQGSFLAKGPDAPTSKFGPQKAAPSNVRVITFTDYAPDVCKDYKQTGFCGFGDSCKFLHAREDYQAGWAIDRDWEVKTKDGKNQKGTVIGSMSLTERQGERGTDHDDQELEKIPFACIICKGPYKNPVVTKCNHYFCETCALKRYHKHPNCEACGAGTSGVFNAAKNLSRLLERKSQRESERAD